MVEETREQRARKACEVLTVLSQEFRRWLESGPNAQPHYPGAGRPFSTGDLKRFVAELDNAAAMLAFAAPPVVEVGDLYDFLAHISAIIDGPAIEDSGGTTRAVDVNDLTEIIDRLSAPPLPTAGREALPDIEAEGERIANETWKHPSGNYLWTDVVGAIQTAIAEERARHAGSDEAEFELCQGDDIAAHTSGPRDRALAEIMHYATVYGQDGPVEVFEVIRKPVALALTTEGAGE